MPWNMSNPLYRWKLKHGKLKTNAKVNKPAKRKRIRISIRRNPIKMSRRKRSYRRRYSPRRWFARRRSSKTTIPLAPVLGLATTIFGNSVIPAIQGGDFATVFNELKWNLTGISTDGKLQWGALVQNWMPTLVGLGVHMTIGRKVNPILARNKVPYLRV